MRILLIQGYLGRKEPPVVPLGLSSLAANIAEGHSIRIFDPNTVENPIENTRTAIEEYLPDIIGISIRNIDSPRHTDLYYYFPHIKKYISEIKNFAKTTPIAAGGGAFSLYPNEIMEQCPGIDFGFSGEAEITFNRFIEGGMTPRALKGIYYRNAGKVEFTGKAEAPKFAELKSPKWDLLDLKPYISFTGKSSIGVESKRGCAFNCAYCVYPLLNGNKIRMKAPVKVVDEIAYLQNTFGVDRIFFTDPIFNFPLKNAVEICEELLKRKIQIKWGAYHHYAYISAEYVKLAQEAGCDEFYFSPDSATTGGMKILRKGGTSADLKKSLEIIAGDGKAKAGYNFFAVFPGSGWKEIIAAIKFIITARLKLKNRLSRYKLSYLMPAPGTPVCKLIKSKAIIGKLPEDEKAMVKLLFRKSESKLLNILLFLHFHWGRKFGKKNVIGK